MRGRYGGNRSLSIARASASARESGSRTGTRVPSAPACKTSRGPLVQSVATTGVPSASASRRTVGRPPPTGTKARTRGQPQSPDRGSPGIPGDGHRPRCPTRARGRGGRRARVLHRGSRAAPRGRVEYERRRESAWQSPSSGEAPGSYDHWNPGIVQPGVRRRLAGETVDGVISNSIVNHLDRGPSDTDQGRKISCDAFRDGDDCVRAGYVSFAAHGSAFVRIAVASRASIDRTPCSTTTTLVPVRANAAATSPIEFA